MPQHRVGYIVPPMTRRGPESFVEKYNVKNKLLFLAGALLAIEAAATFLVFGAGTVIATHGLALVVGIAVWQLLKPKKRRHAI